MKRIKSYLYVGMLLLAVTLSFMAAERQLWLETQAGHHTGCNTVANPPIPASQPSNCPTNCTVLWLLPDYCPDQSTYGTHGGCRLVATSTDKTGVSGNSGIPYKKRRPCDCDSGSCKPREIVETGDLRKCLMVTCS